MAEHSDVYLLLYRQTGTYSQITANKLTALMVLATLTKGMIIGDSLDAPFMGFIKVLGVEHSIGLGSSQKELEWGDSHLMSKTPDDLVARRDALKAANVDPRAAIGGNAFQLNAQHAAALNSYKRRAKSIDEAYHKAVEDQRNAFINTHLPKHGEFSFTKMMDRATPQLAFGCSAQERFPVALFFYRRKVGVGLGAIRVPHLVIGLRKVRISAWKMNGEAETETITLRYGDVAWGALGQIADSDMPIPIPTARMFDVEAGAGGETYGKSWAYGVQAIGAAMALVAGGAMKGLSSGAGSYS